MRIPWRGTRAASTYFVKVRGDNARPNGRTQYWYALPPKANLRNLLWHGRMDMWKYASLRSIVTNQSSDLICGTICLKLNILSRSELEDLKWDATPILLWNYEIATVKHSFPVGVRYIFYGPFSNRAFTSCSITRTCWGGTSVENTLINLRRRDPNCIDTLFL